MLLVLIMLGSAIWVSAFVVHVRWKAFGKRMSDFKKEKDGSLHRTGTRLKRVMTGESRMSRQTDRGRREEEGDLDTEQGLEVDNAREQTPPGRRGAPEMNLISSATGEKIHDSDDEELREGMHDSDSKVLKPGGRPNDQAKAPGITFAGNTYFGPAHQPPMVNATSRATNASGTSRDTQDSHARRRPLFSLSLNGVGALPSTTLRTSNDLQRAETTTSRLSPPQNPKADITKYIESITGWIARNSQCVKSMGMRALS